MQGVGGLVPAIPAAMLAADAAASGDVLGGLTQLGIGGVLVAFAVWLQDRFAKQSREDLRAEREAHEVTRKAYIELLKERNDVQ